MRRDAQQKAVAVLDSGQRQKWEAIVGGEPQEEAPGRGTQGSRPDPSLTIPTIAELRNPPSPGAFGPSTHLAKTEEHPPLGEGYLILTDYTDPTARAALDRLAEFRGGEVVALKSLGELHTSPEDLELVTQVIREASPRFVAIAPVLESYRENMHLSILKVLSALDEDPELDVFPGYLMANDAKGLAALVDRTIQFQTMSEDDIEPVSIGAIEDKDARRYRSYQKAKVMQKMFAEDGKESPAITTVR
ncbi:MAG: hypothetical protein ACR2RV_08710 [Verrucomicrobiales bacterium]